MSAEQLYKDFLVLTRNLVGRGISTERTITGVATSLFGPKYAGTFASDEVPSDFSGYAVVNLQKRGQPGSHWVAIVNLEDDTYMVYDSFGRGTSTILPKLKLNTIDTEHDPEQSNREEDCGARVLAWILVFDTIGADGAIRI
jgi:hypothetical protein